MSKENSKNALKNSLNENSSLKDTEYKYTPCEDEYKKPTSHISHQKLQIVLIGYGKMGKEIESLIKQYEKQSTPNDKFNHKCNNNSQNPQQNFQNIQNSHSSQTCQSFSNIAIANIIDSNKSFQKYFQEHINNTDNTGNIRHTNSTIFIDFSTAHECEFRINTLLQNGCKVVSGTTGWNINNIEKNFYQSHKSHQLHIRHKPHNLHKIDNHHQSIYPKNATFLHSNNFSLGVNLFWNIIQHASQIFSRIPEYDIKGNEIHHIHKKDAPSGTAITTQKIISQNANREIDPFSYERTGDIFGIHEVKFESNQDTIKIRHEAKSRKTFAIGAIKIAQWINNKTGFLNIDEYIKECYKNEHIKHSSN